MVPNRALEMVVGDLAAAAGAGRSSEFEHGLQALGERLLTEPPEVDISPAGLHRAVRATARLSDPVAAERI